jgi:thiol-disulfide isomerase/thioredoxin
MLKFSLLTVTLLSLHFRLYSQTQYEILPDSRDGKVLKGVITAEVLEKDSSFKWFAEGQKAWAPQASAVTALKKNADTVRLVVFMGTWCEDSHFVIPKLYSLLDKTGFSRQRVSLLAVDRDKKTIGNLSEALHVTNVPTIIVMKNGKETGRVVEYGKEGLFDKELGEVISSAN